MDPKVESMLKTLKEKGKSLSQFHKGDTIHAKGYSYQLEEEPGSNFDPGFTPFLTPGEVLALGAFEGKYLNDCLTEFPAEWFLNAIALGKLSPQAHDDSLNYFKVHSRLPLSEWKKKGWVPGSHVSKQHPELSDAALNKDERGWFQWYCRYWMGRRIPALDAVQIKRWRAFTRHAGAIRANCSPRQLTCRPRQRQALLHWAYNPFL
jgi:hypothetical protein